MPRIPDIMDEDMLAALATLESGERAFVTSQGSVRTQYLRALYLKAMAFLGHSKFSPGALPRQLRLRVASELGLPSELADIRSIESAAQSRLVGEVRLFLGLKPYRRMKRTEVERWLVERAAAEHGDLEEVASAAITRFRQLGVELPAFGIVVQVAEAAVRKANTVLEARFAQLLGDEVARNLDSLLERAEQYSAETVLAWLQKPTGKCGIKTLETELMRLRLLQGYPLDALRSAGLSRRKIEGWAHLVTRYHGPELKLLGQEKRQLLLASYVAVRRAELLDSVVDLLLRQWSGTCHKATNHANGLVHARVTEDEKVRQELRELVEIILVTRNEHQLWHRIHTHRSIEQYRELHQTLGSGPTWTETYHEKLRDHYGALRRFLPAWYELVPLTSTTSDDSLVDAVSFLSQHVSAEETELPATSAPTLFLSREWELRAIVRNPQTGEPARVYKAPYELGVLDSLCSALPEGRIAVVGARRYAPMTDHLLPREDFFNHFEEHVARLGYPSAARPYWEPIQSELIARCEQFERHREELKGRFWVNKNGRLSYSRPPAAPKSPAKDKLSGLLTPYVPSVSILELLLDVHRLTGFLDHFRPLMGYQRLSERDRTLLLLATLYAYGCNAGPSQAAEALGKRKQDILYMRRRYTGTEQLSAASAALVQAYRSTAVAQRLGDPGITMTDSMALSTLKDSATARHHFRYAQGKSILLFQHVSSSLICLFTQALLCNMSEAVHMLRGILLSRERSSDKVVNLSDSAGKSDLAFGLGHLLNIELWPRIRSGRLRLWSPTSDLERYPNIRPAMAGRINWARIDECWPDMMWVLASIASGQVDPGLVAEKLLYQSRHPATVGLQEVGKAVRSIYVIRYGLEMELRRLVVGHTARREHWNKFGRQVLHARGGVIREKALADQEEVFWFLTVVQNAIVLWNALALEQAIEKARMEGMTVAEEDLRHVLPTMVAHINFVGRFFLDLDRQPPFSLAA